MTQQIKSFIEDAYDEGLITIIQRSNLIMFINQRPTKRPECIFE